MVRKYDATAFNDISDVNGKLLVWLVLLIQLVYFIQFKNDTVKLG